MYIYLSMYIYLYVLYFFQGENTQMLRVVLEGTLDNKIIASFTSLYILYLKQIFKEQAFLYN